LVFEVGGWGLGLAFGSISTLEEKKCFSGKPKNIFIFHFLKFVIKQAPTPNPQPFRYIKLLVVRLGVGGWALLLGVSLL